MKGNATDYYVLHRMIREIKVPRDRLRCVFVVGTLNPNGINERFSFN